MASPSKGLLASGCRLIQYDSQKVLILLKKKDRVNMASNDDWRTYGFKSHATHISLKKLFCAQVGREVQALISNTLVQYSTQ